MTCFFTFEDAISKLYTSKIYEFLVLVQANNRYILAIITVCLFMKLYYKRCRIAIQITKVAEKYLSFELFGFLSKLLLSF